MKIHPFTKTRQFVQQNKKKTKVKFRVLFINWKNYMKYNLKSQLTECWNKNDECLRKYLIRVKHLILLHLSKKSKAKIRIGYSSTIYHTSFCRARVMCLWPKCHNRENVRMFTHIDVIIMKIQPKLCSVLSGYQRPLYNYSPTDGHGFFILSEP